VNIVVIGPPHTNDKKIINNQLLMTNNQFKLALVLQAPKGEIKKVG